MDINNKLPKLGIVAGNGDLPIEIANIYSSIGGQCCIAALDRDTSNFIYQSQKFSLGSVGAILDYFEQYQVQNIIIVGAISRPDFRFLKVDFAGSLLVAKILKEKFLGDDNILKIITEHVESKGFKVISPNDVLKLTKYHYEDKTNNKPSKQDINDIELGRKVLLSLGELDVGQSVITCDGYVLGIEAAEGTDNLIRRCEILRKKTQGGVLVKMSKSAQDQRLDVPVVGPDTIFYLAKHGFNGLAIEKNKVIIIKPEETFKIANNSEIFIEFLC